MEIFKALRASLFNFQSSIFNSEVYFAQGMGEAVKKACPPHGEQAT